MKIGDQLSDEVLISYGVPQGSILGPTLFQLYVNDLCTMSLPYTHIFAYADDTAIVVEGSNWQSVKERAEYSLKQIMAWLSNNLLTLNLNKTLYIPFSLSKTNIPSCDFSLKAHTCVDDCNCSCQEIARVTNAKYLGVQMDSGLTWNSQVNAVKTRTRRLIHLFKILQDTTTRDKLKMVYLALCQSIIQYCIPVWGGSAKVRFLELERAQRAVLKVMHKKPIRYPTTQLYADSQVLTVRQLFVLRSILKVHHKVPPPDPKKRSKQPICPSVRCKTSFARQQFKSLGYKLYNKANIELNIVGLNIHKVKSVITKWLLQHDYEGTESLLK